MYILSISKYRWRISKNGKIVISGIGTPDTAFALARVYGISLSEFKVLNHLQRIA